LAIALLAGCQQASEAGADHAWIRLPGVAGRPGAAYFTIHGGAKPTTLVAVSAPFAIRAEMHESMPDMSMPMDHGMEPAMTMAPVKDVAVQPRTEVKFAPGGKHVMLFDMAPRVQSGDTVPLTLAFADGRKVEVKAKVVGAGEAEPK
jgi:copper(I)-binding protein